MDDIDIIRQVKSGDAEAFSLLVERYHRPLLNFIYGLVRDEKIVEDIGQDVFVSLYKSIQNYDEQRGTPFSAWLFISARNRCISELRKRRDALSLPVDDMPDLQDPQKSAEETIIAREQEELLRFSVRLLPEPYRGSILLGLQGHSLEEIAAAEGISVGTVKSRLSRAREKIKRVLINRFGGKEYEAI